MPGEAGCASEEVSHGPVRLGMAGQLWPLASSQAPSCAREPAGMRRLEVAMRSQEIQTSGRAELAGYGAAVRYFPPPLSRRKLPHAHLHRPDGELVHSLQPGRMAALAAPGRP